MSKPRERPVLIRPVPPVFCWEDTGEGPWVLDAEGLMRLNPSSASPDEIRRRIVYVREALIHGRHPDVAVRRYTRVMPMEIKWPGKPFKLVDAETQVFEPAPLSPAVLGRLGSKPTGSVILEGIRAVEAELDGGELEAARLKLRFVEQLLHEVADRLAETGARVSAGGSKGGRKRTGWKSQLTERVLQIRRKHPNLTTGQIAFQLGIASSTVRSILRRHQ